MVNFDACWRCGSLALAADLAKMPSLALPTNLATLPFATGDDAAGDALADSIIARALLANSRACARHCLAAACEDCELS